ncbi:MAG: hypothetical protein RLY78_3597 [Pseudomonadota bacterium]
MPTTPETERWHLRLHGAVQGVGMRPWLARQAARLGLDGWARNDGEGLEAELQGPPAALQALWQALRDAPPPLARIRSQERRTCPPDEGLTATGFVLRTSQADGAIHTTLPPDTAPCDDCLDELFDPAARRWRHPFINCTQCGPRWSVTARLPYDRAHTSLAGYALCADCAREYADPADRRHHAQPLACPHCGPRLALRDPDGRPLPADDVLVEAARRLRAGQVLAVKGAGGYQLVCDARQAAPLQRLRLAKQRAGKPFALMAANVESGRQWLQVDDATAALLASPARPILLLPCRPDVARALPDSHGLIAPGLDEWGLMLPATPLHWLLLHALDGSPADAGWRAAASPALLVVTSANPGGEPLVIDEDEAVSRLGRGLADALLVHDRAILGRLDDSVRRPMPGEPATAGSGTTEGTTESTAEGITEGTANSAPLFAPFIRRARGHVPEPIPLPAAWAGLPPVLAAGAHLKSTVCITRGAEAFVSPHLGDLDSPAARQAHREAAARLADFLGVRPRHIAHDLHPDAAASRQAAHWAAEDDLPLHPVQHHHAHAAAVLAEHGWCGPALALVLDGHGLGDGQTAAALATDPDRDAASPHNGGNQGPAVNRIPRPTSTARHDTRHDAWGGELLALDACGGFRRIDHLPPLPLPGGDRAAREPWRLGAALLQASGQGAQIARLWPDQPQATALAGLLARGADHLAHSSSAGRLFDAAAALLGICDVQQHEADAAMRLEACAARASPATCGARPAGPPSSDTGLALQAADWLDAQGRLRPQALWAPLVEAALARIGDRGALRPASPPVTRPVPSSAPARSGAAAGLTTELSARAESSTDLGADLTADMSIQAARFHADLGHALAAWVDHHARARGLHTVVLGGGCLINRLLRRHLLQGLQALGPDRGRPALRLLEARALPCGDGGLSLGQAAVALARLAAGRADPSAASPVAPVHPDGATLSAPSAPSPTSAAPRWMPGARPV